MCLTIPFKVAAVKDKTAIIIFNNQRQKVDASLVDVKRGDYVLVQNKTIVKKINKKEVEKFFDLFKEE